MVEGMQCCCSVILLPLFLFVFLCSIELCWPFCCVVVVVLVVGAVPFFMAVHVAFVFRARVQFL